MVDRGARILSSFNCLCLFPKVVRFQRLSEVPNPRQRVLVFLRMDSHEYAQVVLNCTSRVFTPSRGFAWLPMVSNGYHWTPIGIKWLPLAPNDRQCPPMLIDGPQSHPIVFFEGFP